MRMVQLLFKFATFVELSRNEIGNKNLLLFIHHAGSLLLSMFGNDCLIAAFDKKE